MDSGDERKARIRAMDRKLKHLEFIQGVINRLSTNSFLLKSWSVVLVAALFALAAPNQNVAFVYLAYMPAIVFWGLDGFFLWQERLFRDLYDYVRCLDENDVDFSMDTTQFTSKRGRSWVEATFSQTLMPFHGVLIAAIVIVMCLSLKG